MLLLISKNVPGGQFQPLKVIEGRIERNRAIWISNKT
jgi:hypothetical protein